MSLPALPQFTADFNTSEDMSYYAIALWSFGAGAVQLFFAPLSNILSKKRILLFGVFLFTMSVLVCFFTNSVQQFLLARFIQGTTVCFISLSGYAIIHEKYSTKGAVGILSILSAISVIAPAVGPSLGAVIISNGSWRYIFGLLFILGVIGFTGLFYSMSCEEFQPRLKEKITSSALRSYYRIITNFSFMRYNMIYSIGIASIIIWNIQSPFIIISQALKTEMFYGIYQGVIFTAFMGGSFLARYLNHNNKRQHILSLGLIICFLASVSFLLILLLSNNILLFLPSLMLYSFGTSLPLGMLNRYIIEASEEEVGMKIAVLSTFISIFVLILNYAVILLSLNNLKGIGMMIAIVTGINYILYVADRSQSSVVK